MQILNTAREELCTQTVVLFAQAVNAANAPILPIMLSTMALPEMEAEEKGLLSQLDASMTAMSDQELHASLAVCKSCLQQCVSDEGRAGCARVHLSIDPRTASQLALKTNLFFSFLPRNLNIFAQVVHNLAFTGSGGAAE